MYSWYTFLKLGSIVDMHANGSTADACSAYEYIYYTEFIPPLLLHFKTRTRHTHV
jgi:hypothetical protein